MVSVSEQMWGGGVFKIFKIYEGVLKEFVGIGGWSENYVKI